MPSHAARLAGLALLALASAAAPGAAGRMAPQQAGAGAGAPGAAPTSPAAADAVSEERRAARELIERGDGDDVVLALAVQKLLDGGDLSTLRLVLTGEAQKPIAGLLRALEKLDAASVEPLLPEILGAAAHQSSEIVRAQAQADLRSLAEKRRSTVEFCIGWLADPARDTAQRVAVIDALGESRNLVAVEPLIAALRGPQSAQARAALTRLTRFDFGPEAGVAEWTAFWEANRDASRDVLVTRAMEHQKTAYDKRQLAMTAEVVRSRIDRMDGSIELLIAGLADEYPEVRLGAARRLAEHENKDRAASAVPVLLRRLGHAVSASGGSLAGEGLAPGLPPAAGALPAEPARTAAAAPSPVAAVPESALAVESDPGVRAQFVNTVGLLGRSRDDVRLALLAELGTSPYGAVTAAAAAALCTLRDQPSVVGPLLDHLDRSPGEENAIAVLQAVALNRPTGVIPRLAALASPPQLPRVRAAAVRALMASESAPAALDRVQLIADTDPSADVHFALAVALGDRVRGLPADAPERTRIVSLLQSLLDDVAPSVRVEAAAALGKTAATTALTLLEKRAGAETEASVVVAIVQALGALKLPESAPVIGRLLSQRRNPPIPGLETAAQTALSALGETRAPEQWLALAESLENNGAHALAAWCYAEVVRRFEPSAADRDAVARARAGRARSLVTSAELPPAEPRGAASDLRPSPALEALALLDQLATEGAPYPSEAERLELQARASDALGHFDAAADFWGRRFALLPVGESSRVVTRRAWAGALRRAGRNVEALRQMRELLAADTTNNALLYEYAQVEEALGQYAEAQTDLDRLLGRLSDVDAELRVQVQAAVERVRAALAGMQSAPGSGAPGTDVPEKSAEGRQAARVRPMVTPLVAPPAVPPATPSVAPAVVPPDAPPESPPPDAGPAPAPAPANGPAPAAGA